MLLRRVNTWHKQFWSDVRRGACITWREFWEPWGWLLLNLVVIPGALILAITSGNVILMLLGLA